MTELDHVIIGKANRWLINRHDAGRPADAANAHDDPALIGDAEASGTNPDNQERNRETRTQCATNYQSEC